MGRMNWDKCKRPSASYEGKRMTALHIERLERIPATDRQKAFLKTLGVEFPENVSKRDATALISAALDKIKKMKKKAAEERLRKRQGKS